MYPLLVSLYKEADESRVVQEAPDAVGDVLLNILGGLENKGMLSGSTSCRSALMLGFGRH